MRFRVKYIPFYSLTIHEVEQQFDYSFYPAIVFTYFADKPTIILLGSKLHPDTKSIAPSPMCAEYRDYNS